MPTFVPLGQEVWNLLLIHHHLQANRFLEKSDQSFEQLADFMSLLNSGQLLESFCRAHIDLVLHGHKHATHWARYGSLDRGQGEVRILGAGSATGANSLKGCDPDRASLNLIVLSPERSGRLLVLHRQAAEWRDTEQIDLFTPSMLRRWRLLRSSSGNVKQKVRARLVKHVEFTRERDIVVHWLVTNLEPARTGRLPILSTTGDPVDPYVELRAPGVTTQPEVRLLRDTSKDHAWELCWSLPDETSLDPYDELAIEYTWQGGALLTAQEIDDFRGSNNAPGLLRSDGFEFASIDVPRDFELWSANLFVRLPEEHDSREVKLYVYDAERELLGYEGHGLAYALRRIAPGQYWLEIPFPSKGHRYAIGWRPPEGKFTNAALPKVAMDELVKAFGDYAELIDCAVYFRERPSTATRIAWYSPRGADAEKPPLSLTLHGSSTVLRDAWRGSIAELLPDEVVVGHDELVEGEKGLLAWPVMCAVGWSTTPPLAVLRIGLLDAKLVAALRDNPSHPLNSSALAAVLRLLTDRAGDVILSS